MKYDILLNGKRINTIVADEDFCKNYCQKHGYTYEVVINHSESKDDINSTATEQLRADIDYLAIMTGVEL